MDFGACVGFAAERGPELGQQLDLLFVPTDLHIQRLDLCPDDLVSSLDKSFDGNPRSPFDVVEGGHLTGVVARCHGRHSALEQELAQEVRKDSWPSALNSGEDRLLAL